MTIKPKAKRRAMTIDRKAKPKVVATMRNAKRKAVTTGETASKGGESPSLPRVPALADAEEMVRRGDERRASAQKQYEAMAEASAKRLASAEYKTDADEHAKWLASDERKALVQREADRESRAARIFGRTWWPLSVAVAWVATRDRNFVDQLPIDESMRNLAVALAKYAIDNPGFKLASLPDKNSRDAFFALREVAADGGIQAIGDPYRWITERLQLGPARQVYEPRRAIDPSEIVSTACRDDHGIQDCLVPEFRRPHGIRFQNVLFQRSDVLAKFPQLPATLATARNEAAAANALSIYMTDQITRTEAKNKLHGLGYKLGPRPFGRVWHKARELAGLPPSAPPGRKGKA